MNSIATNSINIQVFKYDFRPKLQSTQFNYHFIASISEHPFENKSSKIRHTMAFFAFNFLAISLVTLNKP